MDQLCWYAEMIWIVSPGEVPKESETAGGRWDGGFRPASCNWKDYRGMWVNGRAPRHRSLWVSVTSAVNVVESTVCNTLIFKVLAVLTNAGRSHGTRNIFNLTNKVLVLYVHSAKWDVRSALFKSGNDTFTAKMGLWVGSKNAKKKACLKCIFLIISFSLLNRHFINYFHNNNYNVHKTRVLSTFCRSNSNCDRAGFCELGSSYNRSNSVSLQIKTWLI